MSYITIAGILLTGLLYTKNVKIQCIMYGQAYNCKHIYL